jgi:hypothetical protein
MKLASIVAPLAGWQSAFKELNTHNRMSFPFMPHHGGEVTSAETGKPAEVQFER